MRWRPLCRCWDNITERRDILILGQSKLSSGGQHEHRNDGDSTVLLLNMYWVDGLTSFLRAAKAATQCRLLNFSGGE